MSMIRNAILLIMLVMALGASAGDFVVEKNVRYSEAGERCVADVLHPADTAVRLPVIIWFHGGGLTGGERFIPQQLADGDYVVVAPGYRLMPGASLENCIDDAAAAIAWVIRNIADYGGDPSRVFVSGHSAGGYLTSMIGLDKKWLAAYGVDADSLAGLIPFSGQTITHFAHRERKGLSPLTPMVDEMAPLYHVRKDAPPYVIITGDRELELYGRYEENAYMWRMMRLVGHPATFIYELDGYNHGDMAVPAFHILINHIKKILSDGKN